MIILGIDPGLHKTGFGVIRRAENHLTHVDDGVIRTLPSEPLPVRLRTIIGAIEKVAAQHKPDVACVERVFANRNGKTTLALGEARGAALAAVISHDVPIVEFSALQVKQGVTGYGRADKSRVAFMVKRLLSLPDSCELQSDAADALACALCHTAPMRKVWEAQKTEDNSKAAILSQIRARRPHTRKRRTRR